MKLPYSVLLFFVKYISVHVRVHVFVFVYLLFITTEFNNYKCLQNCIDVDKTIFVT